MVWSNAGQARAASVSWSGGAPDDQGTEGLRNGHGPRTLVVNGSIHDQGISWRSRVLISPWLRVQVSPSPQVKKRLANKANAPSYLEWRSAYEWLTSGPRIPCLVADF